VNPQLTQPYITQLPGTPLGVARPQPRPLATTTPAGSSGRAYQEGARHGEYDNLLPSRPADPVNRHAGTRRKHGPQHQRHLCAVPGHHYLITFPDNI
jgi:hypothetical protein